MTDIAQLIDERRSLAAKLAGKDMEIAMVLGERDAAYRAQREMNAQTVARQAARESGCYFCEQGDADRAAVESH